MLHKCMYCIHVQCRSLPSYFARPLPVQSSHNYVGHKTLQIIRIRYVHVYKSFELLIPLCPSCTNGVPPNLTPPPHSRTLPKNERVVNLVGALIDDDYSNGSNAVVLLIMHRYPRDLHAALKVRGCGYWTVCVQCVIL